jgi:hypothetical protein
MPLTSWLVRECVCPKSRRCSFGKGRSLGFVSSGLHLTPVNTVVQILQNSRELFMFSLLQQRGLIWNEELRNIAPAGFASDAAGTSSLENSGIFQSSTALLAFFKYISSAAEILAIVMLQIR